MRKCVRAKGGSPCTGGCELRKRWGSTWAHGCGFPGSSSSVSSCGSETRSWPAGRWGWRSCWSLGGALGSDTYWRGTPSPAPGSGALCRGTFSSGHFLRLTSCLLPARSSSLEEVRETASSSLIGFDLATHVYLQMHPKRTGIGHTT